MRRFNFRTIEGRMRVMALVFECILIFFAGVVLFQNYQTTQLNHRIVDLRMPVAVASSQILAGINQVSASQYAYVSEGNLYYREERLLTWETQIDPAYNVLLEVSRKYEALTPERVEQIHKLLEEYKKTQQSIDDFYFEKLRPLKQSISADAQSDLLMNDLLLKSVQEERTHQKKLSDLIDAKITPIKKELDQILKPLLQENTQIFKDEVSFVQEKLKTSSIIVISLAISAIIVAYFIAQSVVGSLKKAIAKPVNILKKLSEGKIPKKQKVGKDELSAIVSASNQLAQNLRAASEFAIAVGEKNFTHDFQPASANDILGNALVRMRKQLKEIADQETQRTWAAEGMAKFSEIIRQHEQEELEEFAYHLIAELVKYLDLTQGAIFIIEQDHDNQPFFELKGAFAYNRRKFAQRQLALNEGLLGRAYLEKSTVYLTEIPQNYLEITSGLGQANPDSLLIVPLLLNDEIFGMIEMASFGQIAPHKKQFLEKVSENVAASISSLKTNQRTKALLVQSQQLTEELRTQEEEMRQNMEELQATQEQLERQDRENQDLIQDYENQIRQLQKKLAQYES